MTFPNHIVGGVVFTGLFSSLLGWNIFSSPTLLSATLVCTVLPDIDTPNSIIGRKLSISRFINRKFGHRTLTHSFLFILSAALLCSTFSNLVYNIPDLAFTVALALFSHSLFDMMTVSGVEFLYPFSRSIHVLPANPQYRLRVKDFRSEFVVFVLFIVSFIFLQPLFNSGFWSSYNRLFGTQGNVHSQYVKADNLLFATYNLKSGSNTKVISGYVIVADEKSSILLVDSSFVSVPSDLEFITKVDFIESDIRYEINKVHLDCPDDRLVFNCSDYDYGSCLELVLL